MFQFGKDASKTEYGVLFDIGSGSVGVAIIHSKEKEKTPHIIYTHRTTMRVSKYGGKKDENLRRVRETLFSASLSLSQEGLLALQNYNKHATITKLFVMCSSPWSYTVARNVQYQNDEPFKITKSIINDLIESAESEIAETLQRESVISESGFNIVERATVDITVNEYPILNPINMKGTVLSLSHIAGLIPREILTALHEIQSKLFPGADLRAHTSMLVMYCIVRDMFPKMHTHCIIDITGETTEFGIVENDLLIENSFVPYGTNTFIRSVMEQTGKPAGDILTSMHAYHDESMLAGGELGQYIVAYEDEIANAISKIFERRSLPQEVLITVHREHEPLFRGILHAALRKATGIDPTVITVDSILLDSLSKDQNNDVYLLIGARFFHKIHGCGEIEEA